MEIVITMKNKKQISSKTTITRLVHYNIFSLRIQIPLWKLLQFW